MADIKKRRGSRIKEIKKGLSVRRKGFEEKAEKIYRGSQRNVSMRKSVMRPGEGEGQVDPYSMFSFLCKLKCY